MDGGYSWEGGNGKFSSTMGWRAASWLYLVLGAMIAQMASFAVGILASAFMVAPAWPPYRRSSLAGISFLCSGWSLA